MTAEMERAAARLQRLRGVGPPCPLQGVLDVRFVARGRQHRPGHRDREATLRGRRAAGRRRPGPGAVLAFGNLFAAARRRDVPARPPPDDEPPSRHADGRGRPAADPGGADDADSVELVEAAVIDPGRTRNVSDGVMLLDTLGEHHLADRPGCVGDGDHATAAVRGRLIGGGVRPRGLLAGGRRVPAARVSGGASGTPRGRVRELLAGHGPADRVGDGTRLRRSRSPTGRVASVAAGRNDGGSHGVGHPALDRDPVGDRFTPRKGRRIRGRPRSADRGSPTPAAASASSWEWFLTACSGIPPSPACA